MALKQANRLLNLKTPLGDDVLVLTGFTGEEGVSQLFRFELSMISDNASIGAKDIVGKNVTFSVRLADDSLRHFNGIVSRFSAGDEDENGRRGYRAEVVPWLWFLTRNSDCRVFQQMTAPDIIQQIFKDRGFSDYKPKLTGAHAKREYCVQFQETDFAFVSRLMEEEGVFYFFQHEDGKHQMILGDKATAYVDCGQKEVDYPTDFGSLALEDHIRSWEHRYEFRTGKWAQTDYNFETPSTDLKTTASTVVSLPGNTKFEFFEYPGAYANKGDGQPIADVRMEEEEVEHDVVDGTSICRAFTSGGKFKIRQHRAASEKGKSFVITGIRHTAREILAYETGQAPDADYENAFTCIPDSVTFRPQRTTSKPYVHGVQSAVIVGPSGETIYPDKYGRVKIQFHWDRYGKKDENSSCWVRVSYPWAGQGWGGMSVPHIGQEVIIAFEQGDVDRPLIVGRVYNAEQMPPLNLPAEKDWTINRDHYGNEINMKGDEGTISLICPTHTSEIHLGKSIELLSTSSMRARFKENWDAQILGYQVIDVLGDLKVQGGADITEFYVGMENKTTLGFRNRLIGGWKMEVIIGKETKIIGGIKSEIIKGTSYKVHKGTEFKHAQNGRKENQPSLRQMAKDVRQYRQAEKTMIKADRKINVASKAQLDAGQIIQKAEKIKENSSSRLIKAAAENRIQVGKQIVKAQGDIIESANKIKASATDVLVKAGVIKLG